MNGALRKGDDCHHRLFPMNASRCPLTFSISCGPLCNPQRTIHILGFTVNLDINVKHVYLFVDMNSGLSGFWYFTKAGRTRKDWWAVSENFMWV